MILLPPLGNQSLKRASPVHPAQRAMITNENLTTIKHKGPELYANPLNRTLQRTGFDCAIQFKSCRCDICKFPHLNMTHEAD